MCYGKESVSVDMKRIWGGHREMVVRCAMEKRVSAMTWKGFGVDTERWWEMCYGKEIVSDDMERIWGGHREMVVRCAMEKRVSAMTWKGFGVDTERWW